MDTLDALVWELFVSRNDAFARQKLKNGKKNFICIKEPISKDRILAHLSGKDYLGVYQLDQKNMVKWGVLDFDEDSEEDFGKAVSIYLYAKEKGFNPVAELSGGGVNNKKVHIWFFSNELISAERMKLFLEKLCADSGFSPHEIFPKQTTLLDNGYGNLLKLPLGLHLETKRKSIFLDENFEPIKDEKDAIFEFLNNVLKNRNIIPEIQKKEVEKPQENSLKYKTSEYDKFFEFCLYNQLPSGISKSVKIGNKEAGINNNILKNEAIWLFQKGYAEEQLQKEIKPIFDEKGWVFSDLMGWFQKAKKGDLKDIAVGELAEWCSGYSPEMKKYLPNENTIRLSPYSDEELDNYIPEAQSWLIENQIPKSEIGLLVGKRGEKKTWVALRQALGVASGVDTFGDKVCEPKKVLIIDEESGKNTISLRRNLLKNGMGIDKPLNIKFFSFEGLKLDRTDTEKFSLFKDFIDEFKPDLIIVDCLARVVSFEIDKDNASINELFTSVIRPFTKLYGMTWLFIHHLRKSQENKPISDNLDEVRGGSELVNYCRFVLMCQTPKYQNNGVEMVVFKVLKMSNAEMPEPKVLSFEPDKPNGEATSIKMEYIGKPEDVLASEVRVGNAILEYLFDNQITGEFKTADIENNSEKIGFKRSFLSNGLKSLVDQKKLERIKRGLYKLTGNSIPNKNTTEIQDDSN